MDTVPQPPRSKPQEQGLGWEFIKEKRKQENMHSFKKTRTCSRKNALAQENTLSTKKATKKKEKIFIFS